MSEYRHFNRIARLTPIRRKTPVRKKRAKERNGDLRCSQYIAWNHRTYGCLVAGKNPLSPCEGTATFHHVRHWTNPDGTRELTGKIDTRGCILCQGHHQTGRYAIHKVTAPGEWEEIHHVDLQDEIRRRNEQYEAEVGPLPVW